MLIRIHWKRGEKKKFNTEKQGSGSDQEITEHTSM